MTEGEYIKDACKKHGMFSQALVYLRKEANTILDDKHDIIKEHKDDTFDPAIFFKELL